jgi:hypothetical protein
MMDEETLKKIVKEAVAEVLTEKRDTDTPMTPRWEGGTVIFLPGREGLAERRMPLDDFFAKFVKLSEKLRVLQQKINNHASLSAEEKLLFASYVTSCQGTFTSFNFLFKDVPSDGFKGA